MPAVGKGVKLSHPDAEIIGKVIEEGWIKVEEVPKRLASTIKRLAMDENISLVDAETLLLARERKAKFWLMRRLFRILHEYLGLKHGTLRLYR
ncbi:MAG: hypothetical protein QXN63_04860 [Candidatus Bathyarchaeia archaeon]